MTKSKRTRIHALCLITLVAAAALRSPAVDLVHPCRSKISSLAEVFSASPLDAPSVPAVSPALRQPAAARGNHAATGS
eukprot:scaffold118730_cov39-Phaeocystis_antarctica.AAC.1